MSLGVPAPTSCEMESMNCARPIKGVNYRILYFFSGKDIVVISHGISKKAEVPAIEIDRAIERKKKYEANPKVHGAKGQQ